VHFAWTNARKTLSFDQMRQDALRMGEKHGFLWLNITTTALGMGILLSFVKKRQAIFR